MSEEEKDETDKIIDALSEEFDIPISRGKWNYRILRHWHTYESGEQEAYLQIHEVHYEPDEKGELIPTSWTLNGVYPLGEHTEEFVSAMNLYLMALTKTVLEVSGDTLIDTGIIIGLDDIDAIKKGG